jgi:hypothetical protein
VVAAEVVDVAVDQPVEQVVVQVVVETVQRITVPRVRLHLPERVIPVAVVVEELELAVQLQPSVALAALELSSCVMRSLLQFL